MKTVFSFIGGTVMGNKFSLAFHRPQLMSIVQAQIYRSPIPFRETKRSLPFPIIPIRLGR
jgi:hypothetical protein